MVLQVSCHQCQFELRLNHFAFVNISMFVYSDDSIGSEKEFCVCSIYTSVCSFVIKDIVLGN